MCGRYVLKASIQQLKEQYGAVPEGTYSFTPNYNVAPSVYMPIIFREDDQLKIDRFRWGLVPYWADSVNTGYTMINARAESLHEKRSFVKPFQSQRCVVPANGFYEWLKGGSSKVPHFIESKSSPLMNFAGLYEQWKSDSGELINSYTIITTEANKPVSKLHDRMPAMLLQSEIDDWLNPENQNPDELKDFLRPWPDDDIHFYRVSDEVNSVRNNGEQLLNPYRDLFS